MSMRDFGLAVKALGRGVYSVLSTMRDIEVRDITIL